MLRCSNDQSRSIYQHPISSRIQWQTKQTANKSFELVCLFVRIYRLYDGSFFVKIDSGLVYFMYSTCCKKKQSLIDFRLEIGNIQTLYSIYSDAFDNNENWCDWHVEQFSSNWIALIFLSFFLKTSTYDLYFDYCRATQFELVNWIKFSQSRYALWRFDGDWRLWWVPNWTFSSWLGKTDSTSSRQPQKQKTHIRSYTKTTIEFDRLCGI
jgi:hypothetical protein